MGLSRDLHTRVEGSWLSEQPKWSRWGKRSREAYPRSYCGSGAIHVVHSDICIKRCHRQPMCPAFRPPSQCEHRWCTARYSPSSFTPESLSSRPFDRSPVLNSQQSSIFILAHASDSHLVDTMGSLLKASLQCEPFKVLILGGCYAGLSAALNLIDLSEGRAARQGNGEVPAHDGRIPVDITIVDERDGYCTFLTFSKLHISCPNHEGEPNL